MALRGFRAFSPEEVRFVKENLIRGVTVADLARYFAVSGETISKIKRGVSYTDIWVEGEETLRPQNGLGERKTPLGPVPPVPRYQTEEELETKMAESVGRLRSMGLVKELSAAEMAAQSAFGDIPDTPLD